MVSHRQTANTINKKPRFVLIPTFTENADKAYDGEFIIDKNTGDIYIKHNDELISRTKSNYDDIQNKVNKAVISEEEPTKDLVDGMVWYKQSRKMMKIYLDGEFRPFGGGVDVGDNPDVEVTQSTILSSSEMPEGEFEEGVYWFDKTTMQMYIYLKDGGFSPLSNVLPEGTIDETKLTKELQHKIKSISNAIKLSETLPDSDTLLWLQPVSVSDLEFPNGNMIIRVGNAITSADEPLEEDLEGIAYWFQVLSESREHEQINE